MAVNCGLTGMLIGKVPPDKEIAAGKSGEKMRYP